MIKVTLERNANYLPVQVIAGSNCDYFDRFK